MMLTMIRLKSILESRQLDDLKAYDRSIQEWTNYWFRSSGQLKQTVFTWNQRGIVTDDQKTDVSQQLDRLSQFFKNASIQSRRLLRGGTSRT
jgi:hypothetical protein